MKHFLLLLTATIVMTSWTLENSPKSIVKDFVLNLKKLDFEKSLSYVSNESKSNFLNAKKEFQTSSYFNNIMSRDHQLTDADIIKYYDLDNMTETIKGNNAIVKFGSQSTTLEKSNDRWKIVFIPKLLDEILVEPYFRANLGSLFSMVESNYYRRSDIISNIVRTASSANNFDKSTIQNIINARSSIMQIKIDSRDFSIEKIQQFKAAQNQLTKALENLISVSENYPELRNNNSFRDLITQLSGAEKRVQVSIKDFNESVTEYNKRFEIKLGYF